MDGERWHHDNDPVYDPRTPTPEEYGEWRKQREKHFESLWLRLIHHPTKPSREWTSIHIKLDNQEHEAGGALMRQFVSDEWTRITEELWETYRPKGSPAEQNDSN